MQIDLRALAAADADAAREQAMIETEIARLNARHAELQDERRGLQLAIRRHGGDVPDAQSAATLVAELNRLAKAEITASGFGEQSEASMTETVARILEQSKVPLGAKEIVQLLAAAGWTLEGTTSVRGALSYLNRHGRLRRLHRGAWVMKDSPADRAHQEDDIFAEMDVPEDAETPAVAAAEVSDAVTSEQKGDRFEAVIAG
jgi:hypothetical protein